MKPRNKLKGHPAFATRADLTLERIKAVTTELQAFQEEIVSQMNQGGLDALSEAKEPASEQGAASTRILAEFKAALDQLRTVLWLCTDASAAGAEPGDPHRDRQVARATELLHALATQSSHPASSPVRESGSFFDRLDRVIDNYMQDGRPLLESSSRRRPKQ